MKCIVGVTAGSSKDDGVSNMQTGKDKQLPSFWIPSLTPDAGPKLEEKPVSSCIMAFLFH